MKVPTSMEPSTVKVLFNGRMAPVTLASSNSMTFVVKESISGAIIATTLASGRQIKCTATVCLDGMMAESMKVSLSMIAKRAMEHSSGLTNACTRAHG